MTVIIQKVVGLKLLKNTTQEAKEISEFFPFFSFSLFADFQEKWGDIGFTSRSSIEVK